MSDFYLGQIMLTGFGFAPRGFAQCNGQLLSISQNAALFSLLGTYYGGNGQSTFALPNLQGCAAVGAGASADPGWQPAPYNLGQLGGTENVTIIPTSMPAHTHLVAANTQTGTAKNPASDSLYAATPSEAIYGPASGSLVPLYPTEISQVGGNGPHQNMQPYRVINFNIALTGIYPSRN